MGEMMEVLTNGLYPATRHRVVVPEEELIRKQARQSFVFFVSPDIETWLTPINGEEPKKKNFKKIRAGQHTLSQFAKTLG